MIKYWGKKIKENLREKKSKGGIGEGWGGGEILFTLEPCSNITPMIIK